MDFVSLTDWQAATSWDANSLQTNPQFIEPDDYPINNTELNNTGSTLAKITDDIEGEARDLTQPDIGADEFGGVAFDCSSDLILLSDSAVNDFVTNFPNCTEINGDLILSSSDLTTVAALGQLIRIKGDLRIINSALSNLNGLENIVSVSNVTLTDNINLSDISQLSSLTTIQGNLTVSGNSSLKSSTLFPNLSSIIGKLAFINNDSLTGIEGFPKLTAIGGLKLEGNAFLSSLDGLISINTLGDSIEIINNAALNKCNIDVVCQHISAEKAAIIANNSTACTDVETVTSLCQNGCATGLVFLNSQEKIDLFIASNSDCDTLHGDLLIRWNEVTDISGLGFLKVINGYLRIADTRNLTNLNGLENLTTIDSFLLIQDCTKLFNLQGLRSLQKVGGFLALDGNWLLQDIDGLAQIDQINGNLSILDNIRLQNVDGLSQIQAIQGNVEIKDNDNLADCSSICPFINEEIVSGSIGISNNALGCSNLDDVKVSCASNDCSGGPAVVTNMLPEDGATGLASSVSFSWIPVENATQYFFKIWKEGEEIPALPNRITTQNNVNYGIAPLTTYNWQIISADDDCSTASPIQSFTTASFENADLVVPNVAVPVNPFSGQTIELSWEVKNQGSSSTEQAGWYDYVFLSKDSLFQFGIDQLLGASISQLTLDVNQNTTQQLQATLPNGIEGTHYIFVITDQTDVITEIEEANNISVGYPMSVNLTPPPDLIVADIITPGTAFAGSAVNVTWSVINKGIGDNVEPFTDYIYFSDQPTFNRNEATLLKEVTQTPLAKGDTITQTTQITLPVNVFGPHFIHIWTDAANEVYEFASEDNNIKSSNPIEVIVNPPPDLIVSDIRAKDIVSNKERVLVEWTVRNIGASATSNNLDHQIYLSPSPNFDLETAVKLLVSNASQAIQPGDSLTISNTINIPNNITGDYYLFVETDHSNLIFELENEDNNLSAAAPITVQNADLLVVNLAATPVPASSGKTIELTWTTVNQGLGNAINSTIFDRIYISSEADFSGDATSIGSTSYQSILAGDSLHLAATLQLPYGLEGEYYIHLLGDADNIVFENNATQNNVASFLISVELPPSPDLEITSLTGLPTNALAGTTLQLAYTVKNNGLAAITDDTSWTDKIFISDQPIWDFNKSKLITEITVDRQLGIDSSYTNEISFVLPMLANEAPTGVCYIYVYTDFNEPSFHPLYPTPYNLEKK